jgi:hypothetical protein
VKLRCYVLSWLRIHPPHCEHCKVREMHGCEMRRRLEELSGRNMEPYLLVNEHGKEAEVFDSKTDEMMAGGDYLVQRGAASGRR